jgi:integrase/recombinase XerD
LAAFADWAAARSVTRPAEVTVSLIERYRAHADSLRTRREGRPLAPATRIAMLCAVREYFRFLAKGGLALHNPALAVALPRMGRRLPRNVLSAAEAESLMAVPDTGTARGLRDRALLELLYATALRRSEAAALDLGDLDGDSATVRVRAGKGNSDRVAPAGPRALRWIGEYLTAARPAILAGRPDPGALFLSTQGGRGRMSADMITHAVSRARAAAGIAKAGSAHMLRHTAATLMLENGADIRHVQEFLGHRRLASTQLYTHVAIRRLREVHARTHPASPGGRE